MRICSGLLRAVLLILVFPALSLGHCHFSVWKVRNKVPAVELTVRGRWMRCVRVHVRVCVCVCEGTWSVQRPIWGESQGLSHFLFTLGDRWRRRCVDTSAVFLQYVWVQYVCFQKNHEHLKSLHWSKVRRRYFTFNTCSFVILFVVLKKDFPLYILCCVYIYQHICIHICCYSLAAISVSSDTEHVFAWI